MVGGAVTVLIPSVPTRSRMLNRAVVSVLNQLRQPDRILISIDHDRLGAAGNRNRMIGSVFTEWVAFLDDDDEFLPEHLLVLLQNSHDADVIYTGCIVIGALGREIPLKEEWGRFGQPFDGELLRRKSYLPVTSLVRTEFLSSSSFKAPGNTDYDDWGMYLSILDQGGRFKHVPQKTWTWHHWGGNSSGRADRW
jgi:glycosyltransferase involved in cell wall biosynthesis